MPLVGYQSSMGIYQTPSTQLLTSEFRSYRYRRRLLEMTVGARFLFSFFPFSSLLFRPSSPPLPSPPFPPSPVPSLSYPLPSCLFPFPCPCPHSLNPARRSGERCSLSLRRLRVRVELGRQTHFAAFQAEICTTFVSGIMTHS